MNPQGFLPVKPLPQFVKNMGYAVANVVKLTTGMDIPYQEGLMLIVSTFVMAVSIIIWIVIDKGNREDRKAQEAVDARLPHPTRTAMPNHMRRSIEVERMERIQELASGRAAVPPDPADAHSNYGYVQVSSQTAHMRRRPQS